MNDVICGDKPRGHKGKEKFVSHLSLEGLRRLDFAVDDGVGLVRLGLVYRVVPSLRQVAETDPPS